MVKRLERYLAGGIGSNKKKDGKSGQGKAKSDNSIDPSAAALVVEQSEVLDRLRDETLKVVQSYQPAQSLSLDQAQLSKLCSFKLLKAIPKDAMRSLAAKETNGGGDVGMTDDVIGASTSICPAIGGRSRGKIDKVTMSEHLVEALTKSVDTIVGGRTSSSIKILSMTTQKGGRINIYLRVVTSNGSKSNSSNDETMADNDDDDDEDAASMDIDTAPPAKPTRSNVADTPDVVGDFLRKTNLEMPESYRQQQNGTPGASSSPPYELTVRSVPAHISASQPEVHRLFAKYQTSIHGDADPFAPVGEMKTSGENGGSTNSVQKLGVANGGADASKNGLGGSPDGSSNYGIEEDDNYTWGSDDSDDDLDGPLSDDDEEEEESTWRRDIYDVDKIYAHMNARSRLRIKKGYANFHRFLCETPLPLVQPKSRNDERFRLDEEGYDTHIPLGTYHQQYRINGVLIAVGVVDVLPHCLSSVYAFYDPGLSSHLELGKYTALREIEWVKRACVHRTDLVYYYLGYYIRSCTKMVYKAEYKPSELLCPTSGRWVDFEIAKKRLDTFSPVRHCCALYVEDDGAASGGDGDHEDDDDDDDDAMPTIPKSTSRPWWKGSCWTLAAEEVVVAVTTASPPVTVGMLNRQGRVIVEPIVQEFIDEVGVEVSTRCIIRLS